MDISNINGISTGDIKSFFNNTSLTKTDKTDSFSDVLSAAMGSIGETFDIQEKETKQYISVKIGEEKFGIDIGYVDNIVRMQKITRVPKAQKYFKGIINLRGDIVPVMSARIKMGLDDDVYTSSTRIIILKLEEKGEIGLIVDEVCEVVTLVVDEIDKPNIDASSTGKELFINGIGKNGDELISLFEIGSIVSDKDAN